MRQLYTYLYLIMVTCALAACDMEPADQSLSPRPSKSADKLIVVCEGLWGMDNACLAYIEGGEVIDKWFRTMNPGMKLGDTGNDILQVNDTLIAISVNWSNIIQYIYPDGRAIAATENIPNNRKLATDGQRYLYCTSYADQGYVAKVDIRTKEVVDTCHVGYEPEGIAYYDGRLYVANTGGYAFQSGHDYESTVSVVDAETMCELRRIDTGCINLYGKMSQSGQYLCINSCGDYYDVKPQTVVFNMANDEYYVFDFPATYNTAYAGTFYTIGSEYSYVTNKYRYSMHTISLPSMAYATGLGLYHEAEATIEAMDSPYGIYISPYTGHLYASDARSYATNGYVYEFSPDDSTDIVRYPVIGLNPAHFLALP